eukprot:6455569-Amphidinium_carterae.1
MPDAPEALLHKNYTSLDKFLIKHLVHVLTAMEPQELSLMKLKPLVHRSTAGDKQTQIEFLTDVDASAQQLQSKGKSGVDVEAFEGILIEKNNCRKRVGLITIPPDWTKQS